MPRELVNALWLGKDYLSPLEILTVNSFVRHGAEFHLWTYEPIRNVPAQAVVRDGNEILPQERIFRYPENMLLGLGAGSFVGFSELFRYKVLYEIGGWWSDMDVTCLKPLSLIETDYFFRFHGVLSVVGNIMKCPPKSELMRLCFDRAEKEVNEHQTDWHHAIRILCYYIEFLGLSQYIRSNACNLDRFDSSFMKLMQEPQELSTLPSEWYFLHWMNSLNARQYVTGSIMDRLLREYHCLASVWLI